MVPTRFPNQAGLTPKVDRLFMVRNLSFFRREDLRANRVPLSRKDPESKSTPAHLSWRLATATSW